MLTAPKYKYPPVVETVMGVQFPELPGFQSVHLGLYWDRVKDRYPRFEEKARLPPVVESFPRRIVPTPSLQLMPGHAVNRVWYVAKSEAELLQLQPDRLLFNWRGRSGRKYSTYEENSNIFLQELEEFCRFCHAHALEGPRPNLCEVTYVNHILPVEGESAIELFGKVFTGLHWQLADEESLPAPEAATFNRVYVIDEEQGRLYAEASIAYRETDRGKMQEFVALRMTGRVNHKSGDPQTTSESLHVAHDWVVNGFASITDLQIQRERWERVQ